MGVTDEGRYIISRSSALNNSAQPELESQTRPGAEGNHAGMGEAGRVRYGPKLPSLVTHDAQQRRRGGCVHVKSAGEVWRGRHVQPRVHVTATLARTHVRDYLVHMSL